MRYFAVCDDPSPTHGKAIASSFEYGTIAEIECNDGYNISGLSSIICRGDRTWNSTAVCDPSGKFWCFLRFFSICHLPYRHITVIQECFKLRFIVLLMEILC